MSEPDFLDAATLLRAIRERDEARAIATQLADALRPYIERAAPTDADYTMADTIIGAVQIITDQGTAEMRAAITRTLDTWNQTGYVGGPTSDDAWKVMWDELGQYRDEPQATNLAAPVTERDA